MKPRSSFWMVPLLLSLLLSSCAPPTPIPSPTPVPSATPVPSPVPTESPTPAPTATAVVTTMKIRSPLDGGSIDFQISVQGTSENIPEGSAVWVVVFLPATLRYYPASAPVVMQFNGDWSSQVQIGGPDEKGLKADIISVLADGSAQDEFNAYLSDAVQKNSYPGLERLPAAAIVFDRISVTRK